MSSPITNHGSDPQHRPLKPKQQVDAGHAEDVDQADQSGARTAHGPRAASVGASERLGNTKGSDAGTDAQSHGEIVAPTEPSVTKQP